MTLKEQMEKLANRGKSKAMNDEEMKKTYFSIALPSGVSQVEKKIRILPCENPFNVGYFHEMFVAGKKNKIYDPGYNDKKHSPLNEVAKKLEEKNTEESKILARDYRPKKYYMVKVIERGREEDGPKWFRFKHDSRGSGIFDKILAIVSSRGDIHDIEKGRDLTLTIALKKYNGKEYSEVISILPEDISPLHTNPEVVKEWMSDTTVWRDVYKQKPIEYLEILAAGKTPRWDSELNKYIPSDQDSARADYGKKEEESEEVSESLVARSGPYVEPSIATVQNNVDTPVRPAPEVDEDDEDLPF